jgi:hypothetical protein
MTRTRKILIVILSFLWGALLLNGWGATFHAHIMMENLRLQGVVFVIWLTMPWICLVMVSLSCRNFLSAVITVPLVFVFGLITFLSFDDAMDLLRTGKDRTMREIKSEQIDAQNRHVFYDYNCGSLVWGGLIERTETRIAPGLLMVTAATKLREN